MRLRSLLAAIAATVFALPPVAAQMRIEGETIEPHARVGGHELVLNGAGVREIVIVKGYVAALYLRARAASGDEALAAPGAKRLQLRMLHDASAQDFIKAIDRGIERNTPADARAAVQPQRAAFEQQVLAIGRVRRGDVVDLDLVPGTGFVFRLNGRARAAIPGDELFAALLGIFVGERVGDARLKADLLGTAAR